MGSHPKPDYFGLFPVVSLGLLDCCWSLCFLRFFFLLSEDWPAVEERVVSLPSVLMAFPLVPPWLDCELLDCVL
jgi:hypothetical protein